MRLSSTCPEWEGKKIRIKKRMCMLIEYPKEWKKVYYCFLKIRQYMNPRKRSFSKPCSYK